MPSAKSILSLPIILSIFDYYRDGLVQGIADWAQEHGRKVVFSVPFSNDLPTVSSWAGVLATLGKMTTVKHLQKQGIPVVRMLASVNQKIAKATCRYTIVDCDYHAIGRMGAEHLLSLGHPHFAFYQRGGEYDSEGIREGFMQRIREAGHEPALLSLIPEEVPPGKRPAFNVSWHMLCQWMAERLLKLPKPLAIMAEDDRHAVNLYQIINALGLRVPEDVALIGSDDQRLLSNVVPVGISSVDSNLRGVGYTAAKVLNDILNGEPAPKEPILVQPTRVVVRDSTSVYYSRQPTLNDALSLIRRNFREPLSMRSVARKTGIAPWALAKSIKSELGCTLMDELTRIRMAHACLLLKDTDFKLEAIAAESGLRNGANLCRLFQKHYGMTPHHWRMQNKASHS